MSSIVRAIDVGYGFTKFVTAHARGNQFDCQVFPSLAPVASSRNLSQASYQTRNTIDIMINGVKYEVGPDVLLATKATFTRDLGTDFAGSDPYLALNMAALYYIQEPVIDLLVVGLPVDRVVSRGELLKTRLTGEHHLPHDRSVFVREVLPLAQPLGGYIEFQMQRGSYLKHRDNTALIIDPGYCTLDWITAHGIKPIEGRSGAYDGGMQRILTAIAHSLSESRQTPYTYLEKIDAGLRTGKFRINSEPVDLTPHLPSALAYVEEALNAMQQSTGDCQDIDKILMVGGGAGFFQPVVQKRFPNHQVEVMDTSVFSNVKGFQRIGESILAKRGQVAA
jgi:plasmid segregation protein ParM